MLGYTSKGNWTIGQSREVEEDPVVKAEPYRRDEDWAKPLQCMEERLVPKRVEGVVVRKIHKHLTNAYFGDLAVWVRISSHWKKRAPYEGLQEGYIAYDIDEEAEAKRKAENAKKEEEPIDLEKELDLEEYGATLGPCLKMVLKMEDLFIIASQPGELEVEPNLLYQVILNPAGPLEVDGEKVTRYQQYGGCYINGRYKGVGPTPLVDKIWDLEYVGTCCAQECYRRMSHVCMWLHNSEIKLRSQDDPSGVKRNIEDEDLDQGPNKRWKAIKTSGKGSTKKKSSTHIAKRKLRGRKDHSKVSTR